MLSYVASKYAPIYLPSASLGFLNALNNRRRASHMPKPRNSCFRSCSSVLYISVLYTGIFLPTYVPKAPNIDTFGGKMLDQSSLSQFGVRKREIGPNPNPCTNLRVFRGSILKVRHLPLIHSNPSRIRVARSHLIRRDNNIILPKLLIALALPLAQAHGSTCTEFSTLIPFLCAKLQHPSPHLAASYLRQLDATIFGRVWAGTSPGPCEMLVRTK
jgi:hypothetical protein